MVIPARENDFVNELYMKSLSLTFTKHCKPTATQIKENYLSVFLFGFVFQQVSSLKDFLFESLIYLRRAVTEK